MDRPPAAAGLSLSGKLPAIKLPDVTAEQSSSLLRPGNPMTTLRNGQINMDTFSPVNENGSFEFDRVIKTGKVHRRIKHKHAFRASWKPGHLVLRPNLLSVYKDEEATKLKLSITLSEVTAVAPVKSHRSKRNHLFGVFCPSKNYRFQAASERDAEDWIQRIRAETRLDEEEAAFLALTNKQKEEASAAKQPIQETTDHSESDHAGGRPSSPELGATLSPNGQSKQFASYLPDYSANDMTSVSEWSDGPSSGPSNGSKLCSQPSKNNLSSSAPKERQPSLPREGSQNADVLRDPERVLCNGYLKCLRTKGAVRQWKRYWVVLRPKTLGFYKNDQEYSPAKVVSMPHVIDAAEVDPMSRSKNFCLQVIAEDKAYRLCTTDEESLAKWLGSLKSIIIARKKLAAAEAAA